MFNLRFNRRLLWVGVASVAWAYLVLGAALAQIDPPAPPGGGPPHGPRPGLRLRLPRGAVMLPGRIAAVEETAQQLRVVMAVKDLEAGRPFGPDGEPVADLPPGVVVEYVTESSLERDASGRPPLPRISTLEGQDKPLHLPGGREVIVGQRYFLNPTREGAALIPHDGAGLRLMEGPLRRRGWDGPAHGGRGADRRERPRNWLRELFENGRERREDRHRPGGDGGEQRGPGRGRHDGPGRPPEGSPPPGDAGQPPRDPPRDGPPDEGRPPAGGERPPQDGAPRPPRGGGQPPQDGPRPPRGGGGGRGHGG